MTIYQFYDTGLAHASYAVLNAGSMVIIDPARDPQPYYDFANQHQANISGVIETHPHADFVSSHLEIHQTTGAIIYCSKLTGAAYPHKNFDDGDVIDLNGIKLMAINTPGHSPDSICILLTDEKGIQTALFTGDTLFVGDVGRPDLRENVGNITAKKEELARQLYRSTRQKLMPLHKNTVVYPAHGPGSLCGKNMSPDLQSTIGRELIENYALQAMMEDEFVTLLTADQPFAPVYFGYDVELNKKGAPAFSTGIDKVSRQNDLFNLESNIPVIDTRPKAEFRKAHLKGAINLQDGEKFETWLGSIVHPTEQFYLIAANDTGLDATIKKSAKIGYELRIKNALLSPIGGAEQAQIINLDAFKANPENYTIIDVRNWGEINAGKIFKDSLSIPLPELRNRLDEIPTDKPIVVHCAAGYRSAAAASIIAGVITNVPVYDLEEAVMQFEVDIKH
jgi:hydroxyacylglutathione hydrolase